MIDRSN